MALPHASKIELESAYAIMGFFLATRKCRQSDQQKTGNLENTKTMERVRGAFYNNLVVISEVLHKKVKLSQLKTPLSDHKHHLNRTKNSHMSFQTFPSNITLKYYAQTMMSPPKREYSQHMIHCINTSGVYSHIIRKGNGGDIIFGA